MIVASADGELVGRVKEIRAVDFLLDRPMERDVYVPFSAVKAIRNDLVMLTINADRIDDMGWEHPPLVS